MIDLGGGIRGYGNIRDAASIRSIVANFSLFKCIGDFYFFRAGVYGHYIDNSVCGAIAILFLFIMMMLDQGKEEAGTPIVNFIPMGLIVGIAFLWVAADNSLQNHSSGMIGGHPGGDMGR